ncbi:MAG: primosomal protein N', partial [Omnitrophica WOR_2 bacterium]
GLGRAGTGVLQRRQAVMEFLLHEPDPVDVAWVYAESGAKSTDLDYLAERELIILGESETWRDPLARLDFVPADPPTLTIEQQAILTELLNALECAASGNTISPYLLHGVTGSGKTEIYLRAAAEAIRLGRQVIILVPEIALTPQTTHRFVSRFPGMVGLMHSRLSPGERYDTWRRARLGLISLVVGPRSALFTPFPNPGLIVLDECHDDSYYQGDAPPNYYALDTAVTYARQVSAVCLLGSATPDITSRYRVQQGKWHYLHLPNRILAHRQVIQSQTSRLVLASHYHLLSGQAESIELPPVEIVDMRQELKDGNRSVFSRSLQAALSNVLVHQEQAILFLNRRGAATYVFCRNCGFSLKCPRCEIPLIYHAERSQVGMLESETQKLVCHHCNYQRRLPKTCPQCGSNQIRQLGAGTESIENDVQNRYPGVRTLRWDYETTRSKDSHEIILSHFANHRADVLVGTQMVAKSLDLPLVTLVGIILADVGLNLPDYRAPERTFQLLTQVAGRAGRSPLGGRVVLQTFQPENYVIQAAARHDYETFYRQELNYRKQLGYPPFSKLVRLEYRHSKPDQAEAEAMDLAAQIRGWIASGDYRATSIIGPAPCFFTRLGGLYRWQIILRGPDPVSLLAGRFLGDWHIEVDPVSLL